MTENSQTLQKHSPFCVAISSHRDAASDPFQTQVKGHVLRGAGSRGTSPAAVWCSERSFWRAELLAGRARWWVAHANNQIGSRLARLSISAACGPRSPPQTTGTASLRSADDGEMKTSTGRVLQVYGQPQVG